MRRLSANLFLAVIALFPLATFAQATDGRAAALTTDEQWVQWMDKAQYDDAWKSAAPIMQKALTQADFAKAMTDARSPLGEMKTRTLKQADAIEHLPGAPDGHYWVVQYTTRFEHKSEALETVVTSLASDGSWHVSGYFIR